MFRKLLATLALAAALLAAMAGGRVTPSLADTPPPTSTVAQATPAVPVAEQTDDPVDSSTVVHLDTALLAFLIGSVMPLATRLLTTSNASASLKSILNLVLSVAGGVLAAFVTAGGDLTVLQLATAGIASYLAAQAAYTGLWRPTGTTAAIDSATGSFGLGAP